MEESTNRLSASVPCNRVIPKSEIKDYYKDLIDDTEENCGEDAVLTQFLDLLIEDAEKNSDRLIPYTEDMLQEDRDLIAGVLDS